MKMAIVLIAISVAAVLGGCRSSDNLPLRRVAAGGSTIEERNLTFIGERDSRTSETVTFYEDGMTTRSVRREAVEKVRKDSVVSVANILSGLVGMIAGYYFKR